MEKGRATGVPITVGLADDELLVRQALVQALSGAGLGVLGEAEDADQAIELVTELRPDVVLMDIKLKDGRGLWAIEQIALLAPASRVLVLTRTEQNQVVEAIIAGASGYILKTAPPEQIIDAVKATAAGEVMLCSQSAGRLLDHIRERHIPITATSPASAETIRAVLTERELEIFTRLASGDSNQTIGQDLVLSTNTVRNHVASILAKLHLDNRIQAAAHAIRAGIS